MIIFLLLISLGWALETQAMVQVHDLVEPTVRFYRNPTSLFPSGQASHSLLKGRQISTRVETWYLIDNGASKEWQPAQNLFYLRDFYYQSPSEQTGIVTTPTPVLRFKKGWRLTGTLKMGAYVVIQSVRSDWSCGTDQSGQVCVPTDKVLLAIDAARRAQNSKGQWYSVKYRTRHQLVTENGMVLPIQKIKAWEADPTYAFVRPSQSPTTTTYTISPLVPFERVRLLRKELRRWNQSILSDHGNIWWQNPISDSDPAAIVLSREEIEARPIYDQSRRSQLGLLSAEGIFFTKDGETWTLLKQFGESNHPVTIGPRNTLVVGDQLSFDEGKTFQNYLRWDQITLETQKILRHQPQHLRLASVKPMGNTSLQLRIDTGYKTLEFEFNTINSHIHYLRSYLRRN
jgi:hypothetical protein